MSPREKLIKSEITEMFDTTKEALRHYESVGLLCPECDEKKYRYYGFQDLSRLRQIFVLKDLGFQLDQMKAIVNGDITQNDFKDLLTQHNHSLKDRIERYRTIQKNISVVLKLIEMTTEKIIFEMNTLKARTFIMLQAQESLLQSPKAYYDYFKDLIGTAYYNERTLVSSFMYSDLEVSARESAKTCIQVPSASCYDLENKAYQYIEYPSGTYLCVYYTYTPGDQVGLGALKKVINQYLKDKGLEIDMERLLEFEHPELSMLLAYNCELYEIQIKVR